MAVPFTEWEGYPKIRYANGQLSFERKLMCPWNRSIEFFTELVGGFASIAGTFTYQPPAQFPGVPYAVVQEVSIEPWSERIMTPATGLNQSTNAYEYAVFNVRYGMQDIQGSGGRSDLPAVPDGTTISYRQSYGAEYMTVPGNTFKWASDDAPVSDDINAGLLLPTIDFTLSWRNVPRPPWAKIDELAGKVNDASFLGYDAGKVLFLGMTEEAEFQIDRSPRWTLDYAFKVRSVNSTVNPTATYGWNHFYRQEPVSGGEHWQAIKNKSGDPVYASANLLSLFSFG